MNHIFPTIKFITLNYLILQRIVIHFLFMNYVPFIVHPFYLLHMLYMLVIFYDHQFSDYTFFRWINTLTSTQFNLQFIKCHLLGLLYHIYIIYINYTV